MTTHGRTKTTEYNSWGAMRKRCLNPNNEAYKDYGGRGIDICPEWDDFSVFLADMGLKPSAKHSIDRIDTNKGYSPKNCRWATKQQQTNNRRPITLKEDDVRILRHLKLRGFSAKDLASIFRIKLSHVWSTCNGSVWKSIPLTPAQKDKLKANKIRYGK